MIGKITIEVTITPRFWLPAYISLLNLFEMITGLEHDNEKVVNFIAKYALKYSIK